MSPIKHIVQADYSGRKMLVVAVTALVFATMAIVAQLPLEIQDTLLAENGLFETLSVIGYVICITMMFALWPTDVLMKRWYFPVFMALFAARELDLDKTPFTEGLLKARQFSSDAVSLLEKGISGLILLSIIAAGLILLRRETRGFVRGLIAGATPHLAVLIGLLFIIAYKVMDGIARKLEPFGITLGEDTINLAKVIEEVGELGIPVMFAISIFITSRLLRDTAATTVHRT
jgi:hypothetical protein